MILIDRRTHGFLDFIASLILIFSPWILDFFNGGLESWLPMALGFAALILGFLTDYELGLLRIIPMKYHLVMDILSGILLAVGPWLFKFSNFVYLPHLFFGIVLIFLALITDPIPIYKRDIAER